jgi:hypothetical protein
MGQVVHEVSLPLVVSKFPMIQADAHSVSFAAAVRNER